MNSEVEVSVIIPSYNSEEYIAQALSSVLNQSYRNLEVILIDDASTDSSTEIALSFPDKRLKIIRNKQNKGVSYSRNQGIKAAKGKWIALLDSDDWYAPKRLERLLEVGESNDADMVADDLFLLVDGEQHHWSTLFTEAPQYKEYPFSVIDAVKFVSSDRLPPINAKRGWSLGYTKPLIRREFLRKNNIWYNEKIYVGEDFILYLECLKQKAKFYLLAQPYYYYRIRTSSLSTRKPTEFLSDSCSITQSFINKEVNSSKESRLFQALFKNLTIFQKRLEYYRLVEKIKNKKLLQSIKQAIDSPHVLIVLYKKLMMVSKTKLVTVIGIETMDYVDNSSSKEQTAYSNNVL